MTDDDERRRKHRERQARWRAAHPERAREIVRRHRALNPEKTRAQSAQWRADNPDKAKAARDNWRSKNTDRARDTKRRWSQANRDRLNAERRARYADSNGERARKATEARRAVKQELVTRMGGKCTDCGGVPHIAAFEFDHVGTKTVAVSAIMYGKVTEKLLAELEQCELVCANCHRVRTANRRGTA